MRIAAISILMFCCYAVTICSALGTKIIPDKDRTRSKSQPISLRITYSIYSFDNISQSEGPLREARPRAFDDVGQRSDMPNLVILFIADNASATLVLSKLRQLNIVNNIDQFGREIEEYQKSMADPVLRLSYGVYSAGVQYQNGQPVFVGVVVSKNPPSENQKKKLIQDSVEEARKYLTRKKS